MRKDPVTGKRRQKWHSGYRNKRAAERALTELLTARDRGTYVEPSKQTLAEFATDWLLHPERFSRTFSRETAHAGLPAIRLHDLRHTWATLALSAGEHPKVVQERLGHANVSITLDV
jgi:integrase